MGTNVTSLLFAQVQVAVSLVQSIRTISLKLPQKRKKKGKKKKKKKMSHFWPYLCTDYKKKKKSKSLYEVLPLLKKPTGSPLEQ